MTVASGLWLCAWVAVAINPIAAHAQDYPTKPIRLIIPPPPAA